jgi:transposase-like protein
LFIRDAHEGLKAARKAVSPSVPWQRCQFHLQQNTQAYVPKKKMKNISDAPDDVEAKRQLALFVERYEKSAPRLVAWAENNILEGLTILQFPEDHKLRTSNVLVRVTKSSYLAPES